MKCPACQSDNFSKNGHRRGVQYYICKDCCKQFLEYYTPQGYPEKVKRNCLTMYLNGMDFRGIERTTGVCRNTVINWVKQAALALPDLPQTKKISTVAQLDKL
ncbi:transposase [Gloeobacter violaceus]|uniref:Gll0277 protein n=1 Tax=Gloeobacter violaceus (strain ATCC 29082 / PCC 7421) TaxID=251221 RepID=Q7NNY1_GLOVI|nr:transposase [Gloeobacter violaceus]BAC88218.1 gll0277 [Gloeobacter violaceus PCC 7421]